MTGSLRALSIRQPWIDLIVRGAKTIEIRLEPVSWRGPIALHSPRRIDSAAAYFFGYESPWSLPRGGVLALAELVDVVDLDLAAWRRSLREHRQYLPCARGSYALVFRDVRRLRRKVSCPGRPRLFSLRPDVERRVRRAEEARPHER